MAATTTSDRMDLWYCTAQPWFVGGQPRDRWGSDVVQGMETVDVNAVSRPDLTFHLSQWLAKPSISYMYTHTACRFNSYNALRTITWNELGSYYRNVPSTRTACEEPCGNSLLTWEATGKP